MKRCALFLIPLLLPTEFAVSQSDHAPLAQSQSTSSSSPSLTAEQKTKVEQLATLQKNFGKKMNSPGVDLSLREISRSRTTDRTLVTYSLYATGLPRTTTYTLYQAQLNGSLVQSLDGVTLDASGMAICSGKEGTCKGNGPDDPIDLVLYAGKAEPKRFALISNDEAHLKGFVAVVPFPNSATDRGCKIETVIGSPNGELIYIQGRWVSA